MTSFRTFVIASALAAMEIATASQSAAQATASLPPKSAAALHSDSLATAKARADSQRLPYTSADVYFMSGMIGHHAQALVMAGWAPSHGASPPTLRLCQRIINAQQDEILTMQTWLRDRKLPVPQPDPAGMKMSMNGHEMTVLMPGMLTEDQMKQLDAARGPAFDRLFLTFMIQHHQGAITMVGDLFNSEGAAQDETVFKFASDVNVDQTTEVARMQSMLAALPPATHSQ